MHIPVLMLLLLQGAPPDIPAARWLTLRNGLRVGLVERGSAPWCAVATALAGGSAADPPHRTGLAHLAEHMMFEDRPGAVRVDAEAEALGMLSNAFTLEDHTLVVDEFHPDVLRDALRIHAARLLEKAPTAEALAREKKVVADERRFRVDEPPLGAADELLQQLLWKGTLREAPVLGSPAHVDAATVEDVTRWMESTLQPANAASVLVGPCANSEADKLLEETLGRWPARTGATARVVVKPPEARRGIRHGKARGAEDAVLVAIPAHGTAHPEAPLDRALAQALSVVGGDAPALEAEFRAGVTASVVVIHVHDVPDAAHAWDHVRDALEKVEKEPLDSPLLHGTLNAARWGFSREHASHVSVAEAVASSAVLAGDGTLPWRAWEGAGNVAALRARAAAWRKAPRATVTARAPAGAQP